MPQLALDARIYVAGHGGMVGSAVWRDLSARGYDDLIGHLSTEIDLRDRDAALDAITTATPNVVVLAAARVGGIMANAKSPVEFLVDNLRIQSNVMEAAHLSGVERLLFIGSSCVYPRDSPQPMRESCLMTGPLEPTNESYSIAKIAGMHAVRSYREEYDRHWISAMPTNLYGPNDNFDLETSHVLPALIRRFHEAKESGDNVVKLWGSGLPRREFLHVDDLAAACHLLLTDYDEPAHINIGVGKDVTIAELAGLIAEVVGYSGSIVWDSSQPDGAPRKLLDVSRLKALGFSPTIGLREGIASTYEWYVNHAV